MSDIKKCPVCSESLDIESCEELSKISCRECDFLIQAAVPEEDLITWHSQSATIKALQEENEKIKAHHRMTFNAQEELLGEYTDRVKELEAENNRMKDAYPHLRAMLTNKQED